MSAAHRLAWILSSSLLCVSPAWAVRPSAGAAGHDPGTRARPSLEQDPSAAPGAAAGEEAEVRARSCALVEDPRWLSYRGADGPGAGRHIVLVAADQEYRSEESLPMLARILSARHGFDCSVLFALNPDGLVDPSQKIRWQDESVLHQVPGLELLESADLVIWFSRLITLSDAQLQLVYAYLDSGKPLIGLRTANHGFIGFDYELDGRRQDFGVDVLGGSFRSHHGNWHQDSTRGLIVESHAAHPILRGVHDVWGPSDVYRTYAEGAALPADCTPLLLGQPLLGRQHDDPVNPELEALPVAWVKSWTGRTGKSARVFHSTMGSARDFESADLRRLLVNAVYWCLELEERIDPNASVELVGPYSPHASGFDYEGLGLAPRAPRSLR